MSSKWNEYGLEEVAQVIDCKNRTAPHLEYKTNYRMLRTTNIRNGIIQDIENTRSVSKETYDKWSSRAYLEENDVVLTREAPMGEVAVLQNMKYQYFLGQRIVQLRANPNILVSHFLYYSLQAPFMRNQIMMNEGSGSVVSHIRLPDLRKMKIKLPEVEYQQKIVHILKSIDDKIQLNSKVILILEELSKTLFKRWFIDFEFPNEQGLPYRSSGGEMIESELGEIPKSFAIGNFDSLISETIGGDWGKDSIQGNYTCDVSILRGADIPEVKMGKSGKVPNRYILEKNYVKKKLINNDIVIEISGGSPTQSTGRVTYINQAILDRYNDKLLCTNFCRIMRPKIPQTGLFIYMYFNYLYNESLFFSYENGTTGIKNLDVNSFINVYLIPMPSKELIIKFNEVVENYYKYIQELGNENMRLESLRDTLLPKLLSGEIEIPEESVVES